MFGLRDNIIPKSIYYKIHLDMNNAFLNGNYKKLFLWFNIPCQMQVYSSIIIHKVNGKCIFMFVYIDDILVTDDDDVKLIK